VREGGEIEQKYSENNQKIIGNNQNTPKSFRINKIVSLHVRINTQKIIINTQKIIFPICPCVPLGQNGDTIKVPSEYRPHFYSVTTKWGRQALGTESRRQAGRLTRSARWTRDKGVSQGELQAREWGRY